MMPGFSSLRLLLNPWLLSDFDPSTELPWESALYIGLAPLMVIVWAISRKSYRRDLALWGSLAAVTLLFSLRELKAGHHLLNAIFPSLALFRNPGRMLFFFPFLTAILAGRGFQLFLSGEPQGKCRHAVRFWLCIFVVASFVLGGFFVSTSRADIASLIDQYRQRFSSYFGSQYLTLVDKNSLREDAAAFKIRMHDSFVFQFMILTALSVFFVLREERKISPYVFSTLLLTSAYADLFYFGRQYLEVHPLKEICPSSELCLALDQAKQSSRFVDGTAPTNKPFWAAFPFVRSMARGISRIDGYTPVNLKSYAYYMDLLTGGAKIRKPRWGITVPSLDHPALLSLLDTGFLISESPHVGPPFVLSKEFNDVPVYRQFLGAGVIPRLFLYRNGDSPSEAWLVPEAVVCPPSEEDRMLISLDSRQKALIPPGSRTLSGGEPYRLVPSSHPAPDLIGIDLETRHPSYLCLSEIWTPGWKATDNGKPVEVVRINKILRGIYLDPGKHSLRMSYRPPGMKVGIVISILTAAALGAAAIIGRKPSGAVSCKP